MAKPVVNKKEETKMNTATEVKPVAPVENKQSEAPVAPLALVADVAKSTVKRVRSTPDQHFGQLEKHLGFLKTRKITGIQSTEQAENMRAGLVEALDKLISYRALAKAADGVTISGDRDPKFGSSTQRVANTRPFEKGEVVTLFGQSAKVLAAVSKGKGQELTVLLDGSTKPFPVPASNCRHTT